MRRFKIIEIIIKTLRSILHRLIDLYGCNNEEVLRVSHRLDRYIVIRQDQIQSLNLLKQG